MNEGAVIKKTRVLRSSKDPNEDQEKQSRKSFRSSSFLCLSLDYVNKNVGTALTELRLLGNEPQMPCGSNWLWEQPIAAFIVINRIT